MTPPQASTLHNYVDDKLRSAFGAPHTTMGKDDHWRLQASPDRLPINVLLNGTCEIPALWIFEASADGVFNAAITQESQVEHLIGEIQERVRRAGAAGRPQEIDKGDESRIEVKT